jgi:CzcA family heavy metal efflux pump
VSGGGISAWSIRHPIGVSVIALAVVVLGLFSLFRLSVDLLPQLIYPEIVVRVADPGVPVTVMEDRVTRQLEEQLAITQGAIALQSTTSEGSSGVDLSFSYGTDIDEALRDASTRLDRARRFLPTTIDPPTIFKRDPSQIPVVEFVVSSNQRDAVALRSWVDYTFSKYFINLPGVAAAEVGGGRVREIHVVADPLALLRHGISFPALVDTIERNNRDTGGGRLITPEREISTRTEGRLPSVDELRQLPVATAEGGAVALQEVAMVLDTHADPRVEIRLNSEPGVRVAIQKQPEANTVAVVDHVNERIAWLRSQRLIPDDINLAIVSDQAVYVRNALNNAATAALSGTLLAMAVVYLFLGNLRRTLIIGSAIPLAVMVTFTLMEASSLTFNIMTLGGLALGVGMLIDNTIVMLENIYRHQRLGESPLQAGTHAAAEIHGAIIAATSTNLAAVLPFLFVGGLVGLLFRELIITISAAIIASLVVALTLVPTLAVRVGDRSGGGRAVVDRPMAWLQWRYGQLVGAILRWRSLQLLLLMAAVVALQQSIATFEPDKQIFLPTLDDGVVIASVVGDVSGSLSQMASAVDSLETMLLARPEVESVFATVGGFIFGRSQRESSNRSTLTIQLVPPGQRTLSAEAWIREIQPEIRALRLNGIEVRLRQRGIRGIRISSGDDDLSLRVQGSDLTVLAQIADTLRDRLKEVEGVRNVTHSAEERRQEMVIRLDRWAVARHGLDATAVGEAIQQAIQGKLAGELLEGDRGVPIRLRLPPAWRSDPALLASLPIRVEGLTLPLGEIATLALAVTAAEIKRENQQRIVEISASLTGSVPAGELQQPLQAIMQSIDLPEGYQLYEGGMFTALQEGRGMAATLLALALFLVYVVMAIQYESLRNPLVILLAVPFAATGVAIAMQSSQLPLSMPVWLGMIMLAGIVVNNAIVMVEYMELARRRGEALAAAIVEAARLRLRPVLMTTLTTLCGMAPLALGWGEGAEMLQPLAVTLIGGLAYSLLVTLLLLPILYWYAHGGGWQRRETAPNAIAQ